VSVPISLQDFMTLPPGNELLDFTVRVDSSEVCVGAELRFDISAHNRGPNPVEVAPRLVITEVLPHLVLATLDPVVIPPEGDVQVEVVVTVPPLPAGSYKVFVSNGSQRGGALIRIGNGG
jgi:hypothetical protein